MENNMTYEEAYDKATKVKWKVEPCFSGEECWCRLIVPDETINYGPDNVEEVYIVSSAAINKKMAEHIVKVHNQYINMVSQNLKTITELQDPYSPTAKWITTQ